MSHLKFDNLTDAQTASETFFERIADRRCGAGYSQSDLSTECTCVLQRPTCICIVGKDRLHRDRPDACRTKMGLVVEMSGSFYVSVSDEVQYDDLGGELVDDLPEETTEE